MFEMFGADAAAKKAATGDDIGIIASGSKGTIMFNGEAVPLGKFNEAHAAAKTASKLVLDDGSNVSSNSNAGKAYLIEKRLIADGYPPKVAKAASDAFREAGPVRITVEKSAVPSVAEKSVTAKPMVKAATAKA